MGVVEGVHDVNWHKIRENRMPLILRDLAPINPFNPLNLWPDNKDADAAAASAAAAGTAAAATTAKDSKKKGKKEKKPKKPKKADLIRAQLAKDMEKKKAKKDEEKLSNSKMVSLMDMKMSTAAGRLKQLYEILKDFIKKKSWLDAIDTFWEIEFQDWEASAEMDAIHKKAGKYREKCKAYLAGKDLLEFQLTEMSDRLPPLNLHHMNKFILDPWQRQVLGSIDDQKSLIVCAPTSSGKTVLSSYVSVVGGRVLFVVPSEPLAWQVAALFNAMLKGTVALVTPSNIYKPEDYRVVVGTPMALESALLEIGYDFQYAVYDEVHDLNGAEGDALERIIKLVTCPFLALSATIGNAKALQGWWQQHHSSEVILMEHQSRFINLQRMIWHEEKLQELHPCAAVTLDYLSKEGFSAGDLAFTPRDTYALWKALEKCFPASEVAEYEPHTFFERFKDSKRVSLLESKAYEDAIKSRLSELAKTHPAETEKLLDSFKPKLGDVKEDEKVDLYSIVKPLCEKSLIPAIAFQLNSVRCRQIFDGLLSALEDAEIAKYPSYREKVEKEMEEWEKVNKRKDASKSKMRQEEERDAQDFQETPPPDLHAPHPDFVLTPMGFRLSSAEFREIKWQLRYELSGNTEDGHALIRALRRGIGIYIQRLPAAYLRVVQALAQAGRLAVVLSDDALAYGVNMPFRTCLFCEDSGRDVLTSLMVQQMAGRAGRRGLDRQGNIVFAGMEWSRIQELMRGLLPDVVGNPTLYPTIAMQAHLSSHMTPEMVHKVTSHSLISYIQGQSSESEEKEEQEYLANSNQWMLELGLLEPGSKADDLPKLAVDGNVARMIWEMRDNPAEAVGIFYLLETLYEAFNHKSGEQIGLQMSLFNILLRVVDRTPFHEELSHAAPMPVLAGSEEWWEKVTEVLEIYAKKVEHMPPSMQLNVPLSDKLDGYVFNTLVENRVPVGLDTAQLDLIKKRLWHVGDRLRLMHNFLNSSRKYLVLEEILRKCFRRIKWILIDSEV